MKKHILKLLALSILLLVLLGCSKVPSSTPGDGVIPEQNAEQETDSTQESADHQESSDPQSETEETEQADDNEDDLPLVIVPQDEPAQKTEEDSGKAPAEDTATDGKATESKPVDSPQQPSETPDSPETPAQPETPPIPGDLPQDEDELPLVPAG